MLPEIWEPNLTVVFVGTAAVEPSNTLGFFYLHSKNRFWELLELEAITPKRIISPQERKALADGHATGSLSDPIRSIFIQKKTSQLLHLGIGLTDLNRRVVAGNDKDKAAKPSGDDIREFVAKAEKLAPRILAFVTTSDIFVESFKSRYPDATSALGLQPFSIGTSEVWLLGPTGIQLRGDALTSQEDAFFALGERIAALKGESSKG